MKKIKNKFIILVFVLISFILFIWIYNSYFSDWERKTFAILLDWKWILNEKELILEKKELLKIWDIVKTIWDNSLVVIEWWDWSVTRIWWNSSIEIKEIFAEKDLSKINISFKLLSWKSWSNVINYMWEDSYFKESFRDIEAWVRWTIFNVDLENDYINVIKHKVNLKKQDWKIFNVWENKPFSLKTFSFIKLEEFINNIKNKSFEEFNKSLDNEFLKILNKNLENTISSLKTFSKINSKSLSAWEKKELFNKIMIEYQKLNFVDSSNQKWFSKKIEYKEALINLSSQKEKEKLIENTLYDFWDALENKNVDWFNQILKIFNENENVMKSLNINLENYIKSWYIPEWFQKSFIKNIWVLENIFWKNFINNFSIKNLDSLKEKIEKQLEKNLDKNLENVTWLKEKTKNFINNFLDKNINKEKVKKALEK